jgi:hypothetical protein
VVVNGAVRPIPMPDPGAQYAAWLVLDAVAQAATRHLFLHASAVTIERGAVLCAAASGHGKSTLAAALVEQGAGRLNDDVTPIELRSGVAEWFPKGEPATAPPAVERAPVSDVVFLGPRTHTGAVRLALDRLPVDAPDLLAWAEQAGVSVRCRDAYCEVSAGETGHTGLEALLAHCEAAGVTLLRDLAAPPPAFGDRPRIARLTRTQAAPWLVAHAFGRTRGVSTRMLWEAVTSLGATRFWEVQPGPPETTAAALLAAIEAEATVGERDAHERPTDLLP